MTAANKLAVVAVGGNSLIRDKQHESIPDQSEEAAITAHYIADMIEAGWNVVVTHGNGPQMGFVLRRSELSLKFTIFFDCCSRPSASLIAINAEIR